jgi:hypothetical protein
MADLSGLNATTVGRRKAEPVILTFISWSNSGRLQEAEGVHLITPEMALWAHEVRLDSNDQRHADENAPLPTKEEAEKTVQFANALAQFLLVLPAMVRRGRGTPGTQCETPATVTSSEPPTASTVY